MNRRNFLQATVAAFAASASTVIFAREKVLTKILLRSSWQTVNIGDIAHTPGMLALLEKHRPDAGVPSVLVRQPTDTRKGQMWYDLKMNDWVFEVDNTSGMQIAERLVQIGHDLRAARETAANARSLSHELMASMIAAIP
ncbi:MAG: hypothetical protein WKF77_14810 [Planctomycetaceae bacterium]